METTTVLMTVSDAERAVLDRMQSLPAQPGATEGPLRIESITDVDSRQGRVVVQLEVANPAGTGDSAEILERRFRTRMGEISATGAISD